MTANTSFLETLTGEIAVVWAFKKDMTAQNTTIAAFKMAIKNRAANRGLVFHSDGGIQYACNYFRMLLKEHRILPSMSRKGNCWDNAVAESFKKKCELGEAFVTSHTTICKYECDEMTPSIKMFQLSPKRKRMFTYYR